MDSARKRAAVEHGSNPFGTRLSRLSRLVQALACCAAFGFTAGAAAGPLLITNGGFESGDLSGWTVASQAGSDVGGFLADSTAGYSPFVHPTAGPASGQFYAVADSAGIGAHVMMQAFTLANASLLHVSFKLFASAYLGSPAALNPAGLDFTAGDNLQARVDILGASADAFDTGAGVVANLFSGVDAAGDPAWSLFEFDVALDAGTYWLRFASVNTTDFLTTGVDDVALSAAPAGQLPEPTGLVLVGLGLAALAGARGPRRPPR